MYICKNHCTFSRTSRLTNIQGIAKQIYKAYTIMYNLVQEYTITTRIYND